MDLQAPALSDLTNFDRQNPDLLQVTNGIASPTSELLYFEELNDRPLSLTIADDLTIPESIDSLHNSVAQFEVDDFNDLQLDILNGNSSGDSSDDDFAGLDINPLGYSGTTIDPTTERDKVSRSLGASKIVPHPACWSQRNLLLR